MAAAAGICTGSALLPPCAGLQTSQRCQMGEVQLECNAAAVLVPWVSSRGLQALR